MSYIELENISKEFKVKDRRKGRFSGVADFFAPKFQAKVAADNISFKIEQGEKVGYIGANGAGKSTTIKMLTGILLPTSGTLTVNGREPYKNRKINAMEMGVVFGQRSQLLWDLPVIEALDLYKKMYNIEDKRYKENLDMFYDLLGLEEFVKQPSRQLSLGQRMRANLTLAMIHDPKVIYLDEPTIGLDVLAKENIRTFINKVNEERNTTIILTTHDMSDIEAVCDRIILIDKGKKLYDDTLQSFKTNYSDGYSVKVSFKDLNQTIKDTRFKFIDKKETESIYKVKHDILPPGQALAFLTKNYEIRDISIAETPIEEIVKSIYRS